MFLLSKMPGGKKKKENHTRKNSISDHVRLKICVTLLLKALIS